MADSRALGSTGETAIRYEGNRAVQAFVKGNGIGRHEAFRHTGALRAFITDKENVTLVDLTGNDGLLAVFFRVKDPCRTDVVHHIGILDSREFNDTAIRSNIAVKNSQRAIFIGVFRFADDIFRIDTVSLEIPKTAFKEVALFNHFQIFTERTARNGQDVEVQFVFEVHLDHRNPAGIPEEFCNVFATGLYIRQILDALTDFIKHARMNVNAELMGNRREMNRRIGRTADCLMDFNGIDKGCFRHDFRRRDAFFRQFHDFLACQTGITLAFHQRGRYDSIARKGHTECFRHALHRAGGPHELAGTTGRTAGQFVIAHFIFADQTAFVTGRNRAGKVRRRAPRAAAHGAAGNVDNRHIEAGRYFQMGRYSLIAAGNQNNPVPGNNIGMDFYHIGNDFTTGQDKVHAVMALRPSVTDIGNMEISRLATCFIYANGCLFGIFIKMNTARVAFTPYIINQNLRFRKIAFGEFGAEFQCIRLGPYFTYAFTSLFHSCSSLCIGLGISI